MNPIIHGTYPQLVNTLMSGTVIDTAIWTVADASDCVTMAQSNGVGLVFTNAHSCNTALYDNSLKSISTVSASGSKGVSIQANITWTDGQPAPANSVAGIMLWKDANNYAMFRSDGTNGNEIRIQIQHSSANKYDVLSTGVLKGTDFRITYNFTSTEIKFWYNAGGIWAQIGTTQAFDIAGGSPLYMYIVDLDLTTKTGADTVTFKNAYMYRTDDLKFANI